MPRYIGAYRGGVRPSAPTTGFPAANALSKPNQRPKAATYLCRFAAKARFDNRPNPRVRFPKGRAAALPFGRFKGKRFLRKGGNRNPPFLKPFFGYFLSGKKVTRRRQKKERKTTGRTTPPSPTPAYQTHKRKKETASRRSLFCVFPRLSRPWARRSGGRTCRCWLRRTRGIPSPSPAPRPPQAHP